jgi:hypothetical protein
MRSLGVLLCLASQRRHLNPAARWPEAVAGFSAAVELLGRVALRSFVRSDQERLLPALDGLASEAAACCVRAERADRAVELFERAAGDC